MKGIAILVGLKEVDPTYYGGWDGKSGCWGCELDVDNVGKLLANKGFQIKKLKTRDATAENVLSTLNDTIKVLKPGDFLVFYYSGHGGQVVDTNGDELDRKDETLVCYNRELIDDELDIIWQKVPSNVRIVMLSDSCHSGTNHKAINRPATVNESSVIKFFNKNNNNAINDMHGMLIHIGACRDQQTSDGTITGGVFTIAFCKICNQVDGCKKNYKELYNAILKHTAHSTQKAEYHEYGDINSIAFKKFRNQSIFTIQEFQDENITADEKIFD